MKLNCRIIRRRLVQHRAEALSTLRECKAHVPELLLLQLAGLHWRRVLHLFRHSNSNSQSSSILRNSGKTRGNPWQQLHMRSQRQRHRSAHQEVALHNLRQGVALHSLLQTRHRGEVSST